MDKATYVGFAILELSKLEMYETYFDELQPFFWIGFFTITLYRYGWFDIEYENKKY